ncbi:MAG TPA: FecR domain-containing protein [Chryseolinea sp.]|nr:FecR domain-containing protein [Chryseolinea sp.]
MKRSDFDRLIDRYLTGKVTELERQKIEAWLHVNKTERNGELELSEEVEQRLFRSITDPEETIDDVVALYPGQPRLTKFVAGHWGQIAASVIVVMSLSFVIWLQWKKTEPDRFAAIENPEKLLLNDGTIVWLQPGGQFSYFQNEDGTRHAELNGEALFEVAKIPNSIFTIAHGAIEVKVVGTSFNLKAGSEQIDLTVLTGKVQLSSARSGASISVLPHERVVYDSDGRAQRFSISTIEVAAITANSEYNMVFDNAAMNEVIDKIGRKFGVAIHVADKHILQCHVTVDLTDNSLDNTFTMLTDLLDFSFQIDDKTVALSGRGCD